MTCKTIAALLILLLACGGASAAGACPECDADRAPGMDSSYSSVDVGAVADRAEAVADTDASVADSGHDQGFWAWLAICLSAFVEAMESALGHDVDADASAEAFASEHGADVDATARVLGKRVSLDETAAGDLDDATWTTMADARAKGVAPPGAPAGGESVPDDVVLDACARRDLSVAACG